MRSVGCFASACILLAACGTAGAGYVYMQDWESGIGGWTAKTGSVERVELPGAPSGTWVQQITHDNKEGYYFYSPLIPVTGGQPYEVSAWINWVTGGWPFVGVYRYDASQHYLGSNWLIGAPTSNPPGIVTVVPYGALGWHLYTALITLPADTSYVKLVDKVWGYGGRPGSDLSFFDNQALQLVPVPGAVLLGVMGLVCGQAARRRLT